MTVYTNFTLPIMYMSTIIHYHVFINTAIMMSRLQNIWLGVMLPAWVGCCLSDRANKKPTVIWAKSKTLANAFISCRLDYCNSLLYGVADGQLRWLQFNRNAAARLVTGTRWSEHITPILKFLHWLPIRQRMTFKLATLVQSCMNGRAPVYLADDCQLVSRRQTRSATERV